MPRINPQRLPQEQFSVMSHVDNPLTRAPAAAEKSTTSASASTSTAGELPGAKRRRLGENWTGTGVGSHTRFHGDGSSSTVHRELVVPSSATGGQARRLQRAMVNADLAASRPNQGPEGARAKRGVRETVGPNGERAVRDAHAHITSNYKQRGPMLTALAARMKEANIVGCVVMPLPTSYQRQNGLGAVEQAELRSGCDAVNPDTGAYYVPAEYTDKDFSNTTPEEYDAIVMTGAMDMDTMVDHTTAHRLQRAMAPAQAGAASSSSATPRLRLTDAERDLFDPMITGLHLGQDKNATDLLRKLTDHKGVFTGIGEVTLKKELVDGMFHSNAQADFDNKIKHFKNLVEVAGVVGMPVTLHCDVDAFSNNFKLHSSDAVVVENHEPQYLDHLKALFSSEEFKNTDVIWAHAGGLGRFIKQPANHTAEVEGMLEANPRLHIDISWDRAATQVVAEANLQNWVNLIEKFPDRVLMGSDTVSPASADQWTTTFRIYEPLLQALSPSAREQLLHSNYERVIRGSRDQVRQFEETVLTDEFYDEVLTATDGPEVTAQLLRDRLAAA